MRGPLLLADAAINLVLGGVLVTYPGWLVTALGLPPVQSAFYPSLLGAVLLGIGLALLISHRGGRHGLGIDGAIAINLCGAGALAAWLTRAPAQIPPTGRVTLWAVAVVVLGIAIVELVQRRR